MRPAEGEEVPDAVALEHPRDELAAVHACAPRVLPGQPGAGASTWRSGT